jgi:uncharacterized membrane protein
MFRLLISGFICVLLAAPVSAQELVTDVQVHMKARVVEVMETEQRTIPGTDTVGVYEKLKVLIVDGPEAGQEKIITNDYRPMKQGDVFYLVHTTNNIDGTDVYVVSDPYRIPALSWLLALFVITALLFGGAQGARGLLSLGASLLSLVYILIPLVLAGYSPLLVSIAVASLIIIFGSYITHGLNWTTSSAVVGMILAVVVSGALASLAVWATQLTGFESDEAVYLNFGTRGTIDFAGLFLGGILIGLLGVLYDAAIGQAVAVEELKRAGAHLTPSYIFTRALRIGREHIGALINTLAIAYVGASLPLLLLLALSEADPLIMLNRELFAAEIVRTLVGSIGIILAVPITTAVAMWMVKPGSISSHTHTHNH